jgi:hypothetical protein
MKKSPKKRKVQKICEIKDMRGEEEGIEIKLTLSIPRRRTERRTESTEMKELKKKARMEIARRDIQRREIERRGQIDECICGCKTGEECMYESLPDEEECMCECETNKECLYREMEEDECICGCEKEE